MSPRRYTGEPTIATAAQMRSVNNIEDTTLAEAVANGRLYVLNGKGEFEQIINASFFQTNYQTGGDNLLSVFSTGVEIDENGETTRTWE
jgi:hypothetical protein